MTQRSTGGGRDPRTGAVADQRTPSPRRFGGSVRAGARRAVPFGVLSLVWGVAFGALAPQHGLSGWEAVLMSATVTSGSAQMAALQLWSDPLPTGVIVVSALVVNLRYLLLGATLPPSVMKLGLRARGVAAFLLFDGSWAVAQEGERKGGYGPGLLVGSGAVLYLAWVAGTAIGFGVGAGLRDPHAAGLDFLAVAAFLPMLAESKPGGARALVPYGVAAVASLAGAWLLPHGWSVLVGGIAGGVAGALYVR